MSLRSAPVLGCPSVIPVPDDFGASIAARALGNVGTPFRLHGRSAGGGLDCIGLLADALQSAGFEREIPADYGLRGQFERRVCTFFKTADFEPVGTEKPMSPGDFALLAIAPHQLHFIIFVSGGFVHAHAGLRRVVLTPGNPTWPLLGRWRYIGE